MMKKLNNEVFIAEGPLVRASRDDLNFLKSQAAASPRHRARLCAHSSSEDRLHEMLIVLTRDVYIRPHKHVNKTESFHVIEGSALVIFFDEHGKIDEQVRVGDVSSDNSFYFRNVDSRYHTQIITSDFLVFHETTNGPFNRADTLFAPWAPDEANVREAKAFLEGLMRDAG
jgi:cupin fold WbuC family metalloprotein